MFLILSVAVSAFSQNIKIDGTPPTIAGNPNGINEKLNDAFNGLKEELRKQIGSLNTEPKNLIQAFGNASVYASHGATQRGFGGYKTFAATLGPAFGFQLPISPFEIADFFSGGDPLQGIFDDGDLTFGINPQAINAQISFNTSFLLKNLYLGLRIGYTPDFGSMIGDMMGGMNLSFNNFLIGVTANYQLIPSLNLFGLLTWRGVNLGTGLLIQNTKLDIAYGVGVIDQPLDPTLTNTSLQIDPNLYFNMKITTVTIPLEAMTAVKLLFLNVPIGIGADVAFGKSEMNIGMNSDIKIIDPNNYIGSTEPGYLAISAGGEMSPQFFNLKLMTGIGFNFGPVIIDIPITWYFADNGLNFGLTVGVAF